MTRKLKLPISVQEHRTTKTIVITIEPAMLVSWCLELCLLDDELSDSLSLWGKAEAPEVVIRRDRRMRPPDRARVDWTSRGAQLTISATEVEMWKRFFLEYYRDGRAAVDHIDVAVSSGSPQPGDLVLVLKVLEAVSPVSAEEARRRLALT